MEIGPLSTMTNIALRVQNCLTKFLDVIKNWSSDSQSVNGITGWHLFRTCRKAITAIQCLEVLNVTLHSPER